MGIFDSLFGGAAKTAAKQNAAAIQQGVANGTNAINAGTNNAIGILGVNNGANAFSQVSDMYDRGREAVQGQYGQTQGYLGGVQGLYDPLKQSGQAALGARDDALGLNGPEGQARARAAFTSSLGYNAGLDTGLDSVMRMAAARGNLAGGNTSADLFRFGADYQNRQSGAYLDRLGTASNNLNQGIAGQAAGLGLQANASQAYGNALGSMDETQGGRLMSLYGQGANAYLGQGSGIANLNSQATQQSIQNNNQLAAAKAQASGNLLNLGMNLFSGGNLSSLAGLFGSGGGGGNPFVADPSTGWY